MNLHHVSETLLEPFYSGEVVLATPSESVVASETDVNKPSYSNEAVLQTPSEFYIVSETGVKESSESSEFALSTPSTSFIASETFTVQSFASSEVSFDQIESLQYLQKLFRLNLLSPTTWF